MERSALLGVAGCSRPGWRGSDLLSLGESDLLASMENDWSSERPEVVAAELRGLELDRKRLGDRMRAPVWYGFVCGVLVAGLLLTPMIDAVWVKSALLVLAIGLGLALESLRRRIVGIAKRGLAGPASAGALIVMMGSMVVLYSVASLFEGAGMPLAVAGVAVLAFVAMWLFVVVEGRAFAWDMRRAG
ncbi:hypothetical protein [Leucobacter tenebrionis]|uniref:hypothetical protein n=1 Tax=Leucobacter tenebrionis TaxID=2873270 RepID=UPI001CA5FA33|nr:hypothetical protein [Leucobacter tenebrionis]QZY51330.1 hypothetical protein KVY00_12180 [Leucobacter tenebrionis]